MNGWVNYANDSDRPELIEMCMNCTADDCPGHCKEYKNKWRELHGLPLTARGDGKKEPQKKKLNVKYSYGTQYEARGESHTIKEWSRITGVNYGTLWDRIRCRGMTMEEALDEPTSLTKIKMANDDGVEMSVKEWSRMTGVSTHAIYTRIKRGWPMEEAVKTPSMVNGKKRNYLHRGDDQKKNGCAEAERGKQKVRIQIEYNGKKMSIREAAKLAGLNPDTLYHRIRTGWPKDKLFDEPWKNGRTKSWWL